MVEAGTSFIPLMKYFSFSKKIAFIWIIGPRKSRGSRGYLSLQINPLGRVRLPWFGAGNSSSLSKLFKLVNHSYLELFPVLKPWEPNRALVFCQGEEAT